MIASIWPAAAAPRGRERVVDLHNHDHGKDKQDKHVCSPSRRITRGSRSGGKKEHPYEPLFYGVQPIDVVRRGCTLDFLADHFALAGRSFGPRI